MKKVLILLFTAFSINAMAQDGTVELPRDKDGKVLYQEVVEVPDVSAADLFDRVDKWLNAHYSGFANKVTKSSKEEGVIEYTNKIAMYKKVKKGRDFTKMQGGYVLYTCKIAFKDGKMRYTINEINSLEPGAPGVEKWYNKEDVHYDEDNWPYFLEQVKEYMDALTKGIREEAIKAEEVDQEEW